MRCRGFTLTQLLAVIAIIGVLAAILVSVLGSVLKRGRDVSCLVNLRQVATAINMYRADNDGKALVVDLLHRPVDSPFGDYAGMSGYLRSPSVLSCPEPSIHPNFDTAYVNPFWPDRQPADPPDSLGTLRRPFVPTPGTAVAYCMNHWIARAGGSFPPLSSFQIVREDSSAKRIDASSVTRIHCQSTGCAAALQSGVIHLVFPGEPATPELEL
ncbi:MAG TPA: type II secretion system protein [Fimbriimonadaceae bacterium]|nr:type II secretion system protein [Fimbriimonadaceae bacterium]